MTYILHHPEIREAAKQLSDALETLGEYGEVTAFSFDFIPKADIAPKFGAYVPFHFFGSEYES